jgi:hypothetical protein
MCFVPEIVEVKPLESYHLWVRFSDGVEGVLDLSGLVGKGVFALWNDYEAFKRVHIGPSGELMWDDQVDLCPDALYLKLTGKRPEELFPKLRELTQKVPPLI